MPRKYDTTPVDILITEAFSPPEVAVIIDRLIFNYLFSVLRDTEAGFCPGDLIEEFNLLLELRDRSRECELN